MKVSIDQKLCTGGGVCEKIAPQYFWLDKDGLAYVKEPDEIEPRDDSGDPLRRGTGDLGWIAVRSDEIESVLQAIEECPAECIYAEQE